jgi:hypothetical protein
MSEMIARMEIAFRAFHRGNVQMPERCDSPCQWFRLRGLYARVCA